MNGDTVENVVRFLEREEDELPQKVTNNMVMIAMREIWGLSKRNYEVLNEKTPNDKPSLIRRIEKLEIYAAIAIAIGTPIFTAVAGALGYAIYTWFTNGGH